MKTKGKVIIAIAALAVIVTGALFANYLLSVNQYQAAVSSTTFDHIDAQTIPNGTYVGEYDVNFIYAKVSVTVAGGRITAIDLLEHRHDRGGAAEGIENEIIAQQKIDVDAVSGATNSSTVIKKAVDNALSSSVQ